MWIRTCVIPGFFSPEHRLHKYGLYLYALLYCLILLLIPLHYRYSLSSLQ